MLDEDGPDLGERAALHPLGTIPPSRSTQESFTVRLGLVLHWVILQRWGSRQRPRPLSTQELFDAIRKGGSTSASPRQLYTSLFKDKRFAKAGKSRWSLAE